MFTFRTSSFFLVFLFYSSFVHPVCVNLDAFNNITANVHLERLIKGFKYNGNIYFLDKQEVIDVTRGNITELCEGMVKGFPKLQMLTLVNVNLSKIQPDAFTEVPKLKELYLSVNHLTELENGCFNNLPSLEILYLSGNSISNIGTRAFQNLNNLKMLHLDRNQISRLDPDVLRGSSKLQVLDLRFNLFKNIEPNTFPQLHPSFTKAIKILLTKNDIDDVDPSTFKFANPLLLHLEKNRLGTVSNLFHGINEYSSLNLDDNQLSCLPDDVMENLKNTTKNLSIKNNPLTCECTQNIENTLGDGESIVGVGVLDYSSIFPCDPQPFFGD